MNDIRIVGAIALAVMIFICAVGMEWETKAQNFLLAIIIAAIFNFVIGSIIGPNEPEQQAQGFMGFSSEYCRFNFYNSDQRFSYIISNSAEVFWTNWGPDYRYSEKLDQTFFSVFAIFFPSG